jgi:hypothetical protein
MKGNNMTNETLSLREAANGFSTQKVTAMVTKLEASFDRRDQFEESNGLDLASDSSYSKERKRMLDNKVAVARFFLALGLEPCDVIERKVAENAMFNAKALKKVTEIARFVTGYGEKLERVVRAFIACAIVATDKNVRVITNRVNVQFLNGFDLSQRVTDTDLLDNLETLRHRAMTSGAETQSSQVRNVLDVLGLGEIQSTDKPRDSIVLHRDHEFFAMFENAFMK